MKLCILALFVIFGAVYVSEAMHASQKDEFNESQREDCVSLGGECTNKRNGCCTSTGYSDIDCHCYVLQKDKKRYNTVGPAQTKCWCERSGYWWEKLADHISEKVG